MLQIQICENLCSIYKLFRFLHILKIQDTWKYLGNFTTLLFFFKNLHFVGEKIKAKSTFARKFQKIIKSLRSFFQLKCGLSGLDDIYKNLAIKTLHNYFLFITKKGEISLKILEDIVNLNFYSFFFFFYRLHF